ncbi:AP2/ERF domain-containing protein [Cynara cardunculus var. scolymus]|uniref:AP2/ERF domain-containing protein n=1 Tax=Cynara cardunculus var. scolymus TaxID=59895 RepID=A0A118JWK3_CYNCS|nr:AP2/ERF domain-containing protein [Cynara cardunculus var. scolymus]
MGKRNMSLGAYDDEEAAARAYDLAALKYWGPGTLINFPVTDYTRDLEEMQNLSREDYLASLRRKGSGFSRGTSKCRGISSTRWDSPLGRIAGSDYHNCMHHGDDATTESEYVGGVCMDRKIDLTPFIKWWGPNKSRQSESHGKSSEETDHGSSEDVESASEWVTQPTEPYQLPRLGGKQHKRSSVSAMSILSRSPAFKRLQEKALKKEEKDVENDENENKNSINKMDYGKAVEKAGHDAASEGFGVALGMEAGELPLQRNTYPLAPFLSAPLLTNYNTIDPLTDPILWSSLVPALRPRSSQPMEVRTNTYVCLVIYHMLPVLYLIWPLLQRQRPVQIILSSNRRTCSLHDPSALFVQILLGKLQHMCYANEIYNNLTASEQENVALRAWSNWPKYTANTLQRHDHKHPLHRRFHQ